MQHLVIVSDSSTMCGTSVGGSGLPRGALAHTVCLDCAAALDGEAEAADGDAQPSDAPSHHHDAHSQRGRIIVVKDKRGATLNGEQAILECGAGGQR